MQINVTFTDVKPNTVQLKIIDLLEIEFMPICHLKVILLTSECTFVIVAYFFAQ